MKTKLIYILAALALTFASADATTTKPRSEIRVFLQEQENGDYRLYVFGSNRVLACEEQDVKIIGQPDNVNPLVVECKH